MTFVWVRTWILGCEMALGDWVSATGGPYPSPPSFCTGQLAQGVGLMVLLGSPDAHMSPICPPCTLCTPGRGVPRPDLRSHT